jgi:hypothetical protein
MYYINEYYHIREVNKPHPASVPGTLLAVAGHSRNKIVQEVLNGTCVADRNYWQFSHDTFNWYDTENWFLVVYLVKDLGTDRFQPA